MIDKKSLSERDICTKFITPAIKKGNLNTQIEIKPEIRQPEPQSPTDKIKEPRQKVYVNGVDVSILISREMYFDNDRKPITTSIKAHTKELIKGKYTSLNDFINKWNSTDKKETIIKELAEQGVLVDALRDAVNERVDLFDLICHVAFDQPPLTRKEQARKVLESLLNKYAYEGITNIESINILKVKPLTDFGSPMEIIKQFGSKEKYLVAVKELETELYKVG